MKKKAIVLLAAGVTLVSLTACSSGSASKKGSDPVKLTIMENAIVGGKNSASAEWIKNWVIPQFEAYEKSQGKNVKVDFQGQGIDDGAYQTKQLLMLKSGQGPDVFDIDSMLTGQYAQAGYIKPLSELVPNEKNWEGWNQINKATQQEFAYNGKVYGIPSGAGGRVLYYNKDLFAKAGLPTDWTPKSWNDVLAACQALSKISGITPMQLNAGTTMDEATTMQGVLPLLSGAGDTIYKEGKWAGNSTALKDTLGFYKTLYVDNKYGNAELQQGTDARNESFQQFSQNKIGILLESDYFWRSVVNPDGGVDPMANRDSVVGYTLIPAMKPGTGVNGSDYVSYDGAGGLTLNPNSKNKELAWELLSFMNSKEAWVAQTSKTPRITPRNDVNKEVLAQDKFLSYVATKAMPLSLYRPGLADYAKVSSALQQATLDVITGTSVDKAGQTYEKTLKDIVGANNVTNK